MQYTPTVGAVTTELEALCCCVDLSGRLTDGVDEEGAVVQGDDLVSRGCNAVIHLCDGERTSVRLLKVISMGVGVFLAMPRRARFGIVIMGVSFSLAGNAEQRVEVAEHPSERAPATPDYLRQSEQVPGLKVPDEAPGQTLIERHGPSFVLNGVQFTGNSAFSDAELGEVVAPYIGRAVTVGDLEEIRFRLSRLYVDNGYVNSGAVIEPGQRIDDGVVTFTLREGRLDATNISGTGWLRKDYVRKRLWPDPDETFNIGALQERFQLVLQDPLIERMNGSLRPGLTSGSSELDLVVDRALPIAFRIGTDNHRPPSTGAERLNVAGGVRNLTGLGDTVDLSLGYSRGADELSVGYMVPLTARDTRLTFGYAESENSVLEEPLDALDIDSEFRSFDFGLVHPVMRTLRRTFELGVSFSRRRVETFLDGDSFAFSPPAPQDDEDDNAGESLVSVVRLSQDFVNRGERQALALRSTFNIGIHAFNATRHDGAPDGQFFAWLGQMQYSRQLPLGGGRMIVRGDLQLANDELVPLERIAVGGARTVRGYRENELVRDNGYGLSLELRQPVVLGKWVGLAEASVLQLAPFMDYGTAWNRDQPRHRDHLHSVGLGLIATPHRRIYGELYWAYAIEGPVDKPEYDWQDDGIHFQVTIDLL